MYNNAIILQNFVNLLLIGVFSSAMISSFARHVPHIKEARLFYYKRDR